MIVIENELVWLGIILYNMIIGYMFGRIIEGIIHDYKLKKDKFKQRRINELQRELGKG